MQIEDVWENFMGKTIARYTDKIQMLPVIPYINTSVAPLRQELLFRKNPSWNELNEELGENIKEVVRGLSKVTLNTGFGATTRC